MRELSEQQWEDLVHLVAERLFVTVYTRNQWEGNWEKLEPFAKEHYKDMAVAAIALTRVVLGAVPKEPPVQAVDSAEAGK